MDLALGLLCHIVLTLTLKHNTKSTEAAWKQISRSLGAKIKLFYMHIEFGQQMNHGSCCYVLSVEFLLVVHFFYT